VICRRVPSGKINRAALPKPGFHRLVASGQKVAPQDALETAIASVWGAVLGLEQVSVVDDFFLDLGGHSLFAALAVSQLRKQPGMAHVSLSDLYAHPTVQRLAHYLAKARPQASVPPIPALAAAPNWLRDLRYFLTGTGQAFALYLLFFLPALMLAIVGGVILTENGLMQAVGLLGTVSVIALTYPVLTVLIGGGSEMAGHWPLPCGQLSAMGQLLLPFLAGGAGGGTGTPSSHRRFTADALVSAPDGYQGRQT